MLDSRLRGNDGCARILDSPHWLAGTVALAAEWRLRIAPAPSCASSPSPGRPTPNSRSSSRPTATNGASGRRGRRIGGKTTRRSSPGATCRQAAPGWESRATGGSRRSPIFGMPPSGAPPRFRGGRWWRTSCWGPMTPRNTSRTSPAAPRNTTASAFLWATALRSPFSAAARAKRASWTRACMRSPIICSTSPGPRSQERAKRCGKRWPMATGRSSRCSPTDRSAPDDALPDTGVGIERERWLSSILITGETYGTRASTVLRVGAGGGVRFEERTRGAAGEVIGNAVFDFRLAP